MTVINQGKGKAINNNSKRKRRQARKTVGVVTRDLSINGHSLHKNCTQILDKNPECWEEDKREYTQRKTREKKK